MMERNDNDRIYNLEHAVSQLGDRMKLVEDGVANFRNFQALMRDFVTEHNLMTKIKAETDKARAKWHFALLGGLISLIVGLSIWFVTWVMEGKHVVSSNPLTSETQSATIPHIR